MSSRQNPDLSPEDLEALRERQESLVSESDDARIVQILAARAGTPTHVHLAGGQVLHVLNIAWGYDMDDPYAHVTTNVSPSAEDTETYPFEFFFTYSVIRVTDAADGTILYEPEAA